LLHDAKLTLAEGAVALWPRVKGRLFERMLAAIAARSGLRTDVPFEQLTARERRIVMQGAGEAWIEVHQTPGVGSQESGRDRGIATFKFQYKGLYPSLEEAARLSPAMRGQLDHLVDEVECSVCDGSRLNELAAAVRLRNKTIGELCRLPLATLLEEF